VSQKVITVKFTGIDKTRVELERLMRELPGAYEAALFEVGHDIKNASVELVPVKHRTLANSAFVNDPEGEGFGAGVTIGYGGAASAYAIAVHETPSKYDPPSWKGKGGNLNWSKPGTGPKYLERPFLRKSRQLGPNILKKIKQRWGSRAGAPSAGVSFGTPGML